MPPGPGGQGTKVLGKNKKKIGFFVGETTSICGDIEFVGDAVVGGSVQGKLEALTDGATLTIPEGGRVSGSIRVSRLILYGTAEGDIRVTELLQIGAKARMIADIQYRAGTERTAHSEPDGLRKAPLIATKSGASEKADEVAV